MTKGKEQGVQMIPLDDIQIVNPRSRGQRKFREIVDNIDRLGMKKPIVVRLIPKRNGTSQYELVCGQGRIEACRALGHEMVPALVVEVSRDELMLMSLAENLARRRHTAVELAKEIGSLHQRGHSFASIAKRTGLDPAYVRGICRLLKNGEERLLAAVEKGTIPITVAITIASSSEREVQKVLAEAYESKLLQGKQLLKARRLIESRRLNGKASFGKRASSPQDSAQQLIRVYERESAKQQEIIAKARATKTRLMFVVGALQSLIQDEDFVELLHDEGLDELPQHVADKIRESPNHEQRSS